MKRIVSILGSMSILSGGALAMSCSASKGVISTGYLIGISGAYNV